MSDVMFEVVDILQDREPTVVETSGKALMIIEVTRPNVLAPPPLTAQKRSWLEVGEAVMKEPEGRTRERERIWSAPRPWREESREWPPPRE